MAGRIAKLSTTLALVAVSALSVGACKKSETAKKLGNFAEKICACQDAACAKKVEAEFLEWRESNKRSRGSAKERKQVEKVMERYATCHDKLLKGADIPEGANQVDLTPKAPAAPAPAPAEPDSAGAEAATEGAAPSSPEPAAGPDAGAAEAPAKAPVEAPTKPE